jgi:hypothetical protein
LVGCHDFIEGICDLPGQSYPRTGEPNGEISIANRLQLRQDLIKVDVRSLTRSVTITIGPHTLCALRVVAISAHGALFRFLHDLS